MTSYWDKVLTARVKRRRLLHTGAVGGAGLAALALVGCGGDGGSGTSATSGTDGELAAQQVVRQPFADDPVPFDPATIFRGSAEEIAFQIYSALVSYDAEGKIVPDPGGELGAARRR